MRQGQAFRESDFCMRKHFYKNRFNSARDRC